MDIQPKAIWHKALYPGSSPWSSARKILLAFFIFAGMGLSLSKASKGPTAWSFGVYAGDASLELLRAFRGS